MSESDNIVINKNLIVQESELINKVLKVDSGVTVGGDLNSNNQNVFGLLSVYDNIYSSGDIFLQSVRNDKEYLYLKNDGSIICKNIEMDDHISIGTNAGGTETKLQGSGAVAIGSSAGFSAQGSLAVAIGREAQKTSGTTGSIAIGYQAGYTGQGGDVGYAVAIGYQAGQTGQCDNSVAMGYQAGASDQQNKAIAIGKQSGYNTQGENAVAIGKKTGYNTQGNQAVAIGNQAGCDAQGDSAIAIGREAGYTAQGTLAVAIGKEAGYTAQGNSAIAIGKEAGYTAQGTLAVAIGRQAQLSSGATGSIAIGYQAGYTGQGGNNGYAVAIGYQAGQTDQGEYAIAIGYGAGSTGSSPYNQGAKSIILNASGANLNSGVSGFYVNPVGITGVAATNQNVLVYDTRTSAIKYSTGKTFVIDHPLDESKYLVHACLEGPEVGIYYRGKGEITNNKSTIIVLPDYVSVFATDLTVQLTPIYNGKINTLNASEVENNSFTVYGETSCKFHWTVYGKRGAINTEPYKNDVSVKGSGPYLWI
jgi:hypothetical protein